MINHATEAERPMPCPVPLAAVLFGKSHPITPSARREIAPDMKELRKYASRKTSEQKYLDCLSKDEWRNAKHLSEELGFSTQAITNYMRTKSMKALTKRAVRVKGGARYIVWRLK